MRKKNPEHAILQRNSLIDIIRHQINDHAKTEIFFPLNISFNRKRNSKKNVACDHYFRQTKITT